MLFHIKEHRFIQFCCLFLKSSKAFSVSLKNVNLLMLIKLMKTNETPNYILLIYCSICGKYVAKFPMT